MKCSKSSLLMSMFVVFAAAFSVLAFVASATLVAYASAQSEAQQQQNPGYLTDFNVGNVDVKENGTTQRNFTLIINENSQVPITVPNTIPVPMPIAEEISGEQTQPSDSDDPQDARFLNESIMFPAWTYNGSVPGPTLRMDEGDHVSITLINPENSTKAHSLHMHSRHEPMMDGTYGKAGMVQPGENFTYEFVAGPAGVYPYHCHNEPIQDHINRGLYGAMIIDPKQGRPAAYEMVMMMNSYDFDLNPTLAPTFRIPNVGEAQNIFNLAQTNTTGDEDLAAQVAEDREGIVLEQDRGNEVYTVNGVAFQYMNNPIHLFVGDPVRIYLLNMAEFDPLNNFHLHSDMFKYTPSGTLDSAPITSDIVSLSQGDRGIIEFTPQHPGLMMFHSHVNEFSSLGWMGNFNVTSRS
jgi:manganese oxidase